MVKKMNIKKYWHQKKNFLLFFFIIFILGLISGHILYHLNKNSLYLSNQLSDLNDLTTLKINIILPHLIILSILILSSFLTITYLINLFYLYYLGLSIGFTSAHAIKIAGFKGFIYITTYHVFFKLIYIILIIWILIKELYLIKNHLGLMYFHHDHQLTINFYHLLKSILLLSILIIINDIFLSFCNTYLLNLLSFML
jgi:hypothetical protein